MRIACLPFSMIVALLVAAAGAAPYVPADDQEVLEKLPSALFSGRAELSSLRQQLAADPTNVELAHDVASRYLQLGGETSDPRFYGYARAALEPWWEAALAPPAILRLRAKLRERNHEYDQSLADLYRLLEQRPTDVQGWIEVSNICLVQGHYGKARKAADTLTKFADPVAITVCLTPLLAVTGEADESYQSLEKLLPVARKRAPGLAKWILTKQAEIAVALGRDELAEEHFLAGLAIEPSDSYLLRGYADFLLDHDRASEVVPLLEPYTIDNGILLPAAIAARRSGATAIAEQWRSQLEARFDENRLRGNPPHGRYEARFALEVLNDPQSALALAVANWEQQKQPQDTRILLEAALAAGEPIQAGPAIQFLAEHGTQDVTLRELVKKLEHN